MNDLPAPLVPAEVDLRDFGYMPLDVRTLLTSTLWIKAKKDPRVAHAAVSLWCECWHQVPAASLPNDDEVLADLAKCDPKEWARVKDRALAHFVECNDGRLYHRHVAKKAIESWASKQAQRARTAAATAARAGKKKGPDDGDAGNRDEDRNGPRDVQRHVQRDEERDVHQVKGREGKGIEGESVREPRAAAASPPAKGARLPADWSPGPEHEAFAEGLGFRNGSAAAELAKFRDYWAAQPGERGRKADWIATWRNWLRRAAEDRSKRPAGAQAFDLDGVH